MQEAKTQAAQLRERLRPADKVFIAEQIARLSRHFGLQKMTVSEAMTVVADFIEDLGDVPDWAVVEACKIWRNNPKNDFRPTPGKFRALIQPRLVECRRLLDGLDAIASKTV